MRDRPADIERDISRRGWQDLGKHHENCPRNTLRASRRNARETVTVVGMGSGLSMTSRAEITTRYARAYGKARRRTGADPGRGGGGDRLVAGQRPAPADRRGEAAAGSGPQVATRPRKPRAPKYSYDALKVLQQVWAASGGQCGKYLAASMRMQLDGLERHGELVDGHGRYSPAVRAELLAMCAASIDRYLRPAKAKRPDQGSLDHETLAAAAVLDQDPQGRRRGRGRAGVLRGRHRRALRADPQRRVRPDPEPDRCAHRLGLHPHRAQQRPHPHPGARCRPGSRKSLRR